MRVVLFLSSLLVTTLAGVQNSNEDYSNIKPTNPPKPPAPWTGKGRCNETCCFDRSLGPHMVLQRDVKARLWGTASPNVTVSIEMEGLAAINVLAASNGTWVVDLPSQPASSTPKSIKLTCESSSIKSNIVVMNDVLLGDVFGCHGQSNMEFGLGMDMNATASCAQAGAFPLIRTIAYAQHEDWAIPTAATVCQGSVSFAPFSAVCWYFGKTVYESLNGTVPIGLVASQVGGTPVEAWSGPDALAKCNQTQVVDRVSLYWEELIVPILPLQLSGWVWYQGENNVAGVGEGKRSGCCSIGCPGGGQNACINPCDASAQLCADYYACQFPAMINDWRAKWNGGMHNTIAGRPAGPRPFMFVMLAPYEDGLNVLPNGDRFPNVAMLRQAQTKALTLPAVGMASAIDWADIGCPVGSIHPRWKAPVGSRLALVASALVYGNTVQHKNPSVVSVISISRPSSSVFDVKIQFDMAMTTSPPADKFTKTLPSAKTLGCQPAIKAGESLQCAWFDVDKRNITSASSVRVMESDPTAVVVEVGSTTPSRSVSYLWGNWPVAMLWAQESGLPASPFYLNIESN